MKFLQILYLRLKQKEAQSQNKITESSSQAFQHQNEQVTNKNLHLICRLHLCSFIVLDLNKAHIFQQQNISWEPLHCHPTHAWLGFIPQVCH